MANADVDIDKLLSDKRVVAEIERHLWLESEKAGYDIGFDRAKEDWLKNFSTTWMRYHLTDGFLTARKAAQVQAAAQTPSKPRTKDPKKTTVKRRRAKSYI